MTTFKRTLRAAAVLAAAVAVAAGCEVRFPVGEGRRERPAVSERPERDERPARPSRGESPAQTETPEATPEVSGSRDTASPAETERPAGEGLEVYIVGSLVDMVPVIDVSGYGIDSEEMGDIYLDILARHPELFYVENETEWSYYEGGEVTEVIPAYTGSMAAVRRQKERFDAAFDGALAEIDAGGTDAETVGNVNDWICVNTRYDTGYTDATAYDALVGGSGVCDAYSKLFALFMERYGIEWRMLTSEAMDHSWNQVRIDGQWLHVDVTWNDPIPDERGRALRDYLLLTDDEIMNSEEPHYDWTAT